MRLAWPWKRKAKAPYPPPQRREILKIPIRRIVNAKYDAAQTSAENVKHWSMADSLSADEANSLSVRKTLRERARYEVANNSYAKGIVLTLANDCVGTGPRLQLLWEDASLCRNVEDAFLTWSNAIDLPGKLRSMRMAKAVDGETFAVLVNNPGVESPVKLDVMPIEADRVTAANFVATFTEREIDGIHFDGYGNVATYDVLRNHPGSSGSWFEYDTIDSQYVIHWYRADRPEQHRGVPEITPALPLFAQLRRYTLAVIAAAETAAEFAAVLYTDAPANGEAAPLDMLDLIHLEKRVATTLPDGWKLGQIKAEQPATGYGEFKKEILNEIARCLNIPYNIAACNSSGYNYASGRLDHQTYFKSLRVEQTNLASVVMDRIFNTWIYEAMLTGLFNVPVISQSEQFQKIPHQWFYDGNEHVDPLKEANAQSKRLESLTTTLAHEYARQGRDWETELRQLAKEKKLMSELGLTQSSTPIIEETEDDEDE
ncbi:MAG TPA: phage portal protein [Phycisphaerae bacterium]|nr:phage portal protein [Phycisphaerae bacterium]